MDGLRTAARAQFQIGLCRRAEPWRRPHASFWWCPDLRIPAVVAAARCEAARAYEGLKNNAEAVRLYNETLKISRRPLGRPGHKRLAEIGK